MSRADQRQATGNRRGQSSCILDREHVLSLRHLSPSNSQRRPPSRQVPRIIPLRVHTHKPRLRRAPSPRQSADTSRQRAEHKRHVDRTTGAFRKTTGTSRFKRKVLPPPFSSPGSPDKLPPSYQDRHGIVKTVLTQRRDIFSVRPAILEDCCPKSGAKTGLAAQKWKINAILTIYKYIFCFAFH